MNTIDPKPIAKNHRGSRFSSVSLTNWLLASNAAFFILTGLALAASIAIFLLTRASDRAKDRELRRQQFEAAQVVAQATATAETAKANAAAANQRAGEANQEAARANERAAMLEREAANAKLELKNLQEAQSAQKAQIESESKARNDLQKAVSGRTISEIQIDNIVSVVRYSAFKPMLRIVVNGGDEPMAYARAIKNAFAAGGVTVELMGGAFMMLPPNYNIYLYSDANSIFAKALTQAGIRYVLQNKTSGDELIINMKPLM